MTLRNSRCQPAIPSSAHPFFFLAFLVAGCSNLAFQPAPVVPTRAPLPYSAKVKLTEIESYMVKPGTTMIVDPHIENHITEVSNSLGPAKKEWETSVANYLAARKTFTYLSMDSQTDLDLSMRLHIYIDPGMHFKFNYVYVAHIEAWLINPRSGRIHSYLGMGKSTGDVIRSGKDDDQGPINAAVQSALNDLSGKLENDPWLHR